MVLTDEEKAKAREYKQKYRSKPEVKAKEKARKQTPEYKEKAREQGKKYRARPEVKAKKKELDKKYRLRPEVKAKKKEYKQTPEYKAKAKKHAKEYNARPEVKKREMEIRNRPENLANAKNERDTNRLKVLQHYSKRLSNSNIPCCNCCGENSHVDFLAIDHIAGKRQMDLEPELKKLKYSSKLRNQNLHRWIIKNNFPEGFQILCTNCNFAKGMTKNNNICPHETIRKEETFAMMEEQSSFEV